MSPLLPNYRTFTLLQSYFACTIRSLMPRYTSPLGGIMLEKGACTRGDFARDTAAYRPFRRAHRTPCKTRTHRAKLIATPAISDSFTSYKCIMNFDFKYSLPRRSGSDCKCPLQGKKCLVVESRTKSGNATGSPVAVQVVK